MDSTLDTAAIVTTADRDRWMAWAGPVFLVVFVAIGLLSGSSIKESASGKEVVAKITEHRDAMYAAIFLTAPGVAALSFFAARFRQLVGPASGASRFVFQYGVALYAASLSIGGVLALGVVVAADKKEEQVAQTLNVLNNDFWIPMTIGIAILLIGAGQAVLRTGLLPRWMGWVALVVGVISLLGPGGFVGFFIGPLWIGVVGVVLATRKPTVAVLA